MHPVHHPHRAPPASCVLLPPRALRTSQQFHRLRALLLENGIQPRANKSSILTEVTRYIQELEDKLKSLEEDRQRQDPLPPARDLSLCPEITKYP